MGTNTWVQMLHLFGFAAKLTRTQVGEANEAAQETCARPFGPTILADEGADRAVRVKRVADRAEAVEVGPIDGRRLLVALLSGARGVSLHFHHLTVLYQAALGRFFTDNIACAAQYITFDVTAVGEVDFGAFISETGRLIVCFLLFATAQHAECLRGEHAARRLGLGASFQATTCWGWEHQQNVCALLGEILEGDDTKSGNRLSPGNFLQVRSAESRAPRLNVSRPTKGLAPGVEEGQSS